MEAGSLILPEFSAVSQTIFQNDQDPIVTWAMNFGWPFLLLIADCDKWDADRISKA
jgi:hypothetical protein